MIGHTMKKDNQSRFQQKTHAREGIMTRFLGGCLLLYILLPSTNVGLLFAYANGGRPSSNPASIVAQKWEYN
jgi:hypothetical protein